MKNWKTTLIGLIFGAIGIANTVVQSRQAGGPPITMGNYATPVGIAILGLLSKDHDTTGNGSTATKNGSSN